MTSKDIYQMMLKKALAVVPAIDEKRPPISKKPKTNKTYVLRQEYLQQKMESSKKKKVGQWSPWQYGEGKVG